jgi:3-oxoacyl-[acyl-carrier protein] reductase
MSSATALVTGATEGIGRAITFALGAAGYRVGVGARNELKIRRLLEELRAQGIAAAGLPCDVGDEAAVGRLVGHVAAELGPVEVLVNNAGIGILKPLEELTPAEWDATMATNVRGMFLMTRAVLPRMRERKRGVIVNLSSLAGRNGFAGGTAYVASKHAVLGFSRALMFEVREDNIRVVAVCPGSVDTPLLHQQALLKPKFEKILKPEDVAQVVLDVLRLPDRALVSELDIRPTNP